MFFFLKINHCGMYKIAYLCKPVAVKVMNDKVSLFFPLLQFNEDCEETVFLVMFMFV